MQKPLRGFRDITNFKRYLDVQAVLLSTAKNMGYTPVELPFLEEVGLYQRSVGEHTDVVSKEMFHFEDHGEIVALRPEGTAGAVRAMIHAGVSGRERAKWCYQGAMFRRERPQKGRFRQFYQFGLECFGYDAPGIDLELLLFMQHIITALKLPQPELKIAYLPKGESRNLYINKLQAYLASYHGDLDADSQTRLKHNPLRIWDSKNAKTQMILEGAPRFADHFSSEDQAQVDTIKTHLDDLNIHYTLDHSLVRGLDYYSGLVFEWQSDYLGSQSAICGGGRYDALSELLGGRPTQATGLALGLDRLVMLHEQVHEKKPLTPDLIILSEQKNQGLALRIYQHILSVLPGCHCQLDHLHGAMGKMLSRAAKQSAKFCLLIAQEDDISLKNMASQQQHSIELTDLLSERFLADLLKEGDT